MPNRFEYCTDAGICFNNTVHFKIGNHQISIVTTKVVQSCVTNFERNTEDQVQKYN